MSWTITPQTKVPVDPYRSQVSLLLHGDGANGSTTITDSSPTPKTVTAFGDAQISTAQSKFGGSSIAFDGNGDYLTVPASSDFEFGTGNFTIELWWRAGTLASFQPILYHTNSVNVTGTGHYGLVYNTSLGMRFYLNAGAAGTVTQGSTAGWTTNTWYHLVACKSNDVISIYRDGIQIASGSSTTLIGPAGISLSIGIGEGGFAAGYIDELRITKGVARYTSNFTPPTAPFPDI